jgi:hypothetical protein
MADKLSIEEPVRRAIDANLKYYRALGEVTQEYVRALLGVWRDLPIRLGSLGSFGSSGSAPAPSSAATRAPSGGTATLVLEGEAGQEAESVFMVENRLPRQVSTTVVTSPFLDPSGRDVRPALRILPGVVTLDPGARTLVRIVVAVTDDWAIDVPYRGTVQVPGLSDTAIPVVLRRRATEMRAAAAERPRGQARKTKKRRRAAG